MAHSIRDAFASDVPVLVDIIRGSFRDVAVRFGLTERNCPRHPSNCTSQWIESAIGKGVLYYILDLDGVPCGCVALERARPEVCYLERLAVLPEYRSRGFGGALVGHALARAKLIGAERVEIGIISDHRELKEWYERIGFTETGGGVFPHLPFEVTFMAKMLDPAG